MNYSAKARPSRRAKVGVAVAAFIAAAVAIVPNISTAGAAEGNQSTACAGTVGVKEGKLKAFKSFKAYVNGNEISTELRAIPDGTVKSGDIFSIKFQLTEECAGTFVGVSSFIATTPKDQTVAQFKAQTEFQRAHGVFDASKEYELKVEVPPCYFQVDVNTGGTYIPGDFTIDNQGRLLLAAQGGTDADCTEPTTTTSSTTTSTTSTVAPPVSIVSTHAPEAAFSKVCAANGSGFTGSFENKGNVADEFVINVDGKKIDAITVNPSAKSEKTWTFESLNVAANKTAVITVVVNGETIATESITNDCVDVSANATAACDTVAGSGAILTFINEGRVAETFKVLRDGNEVAGSPVNVAAGGTTVEKLLALNEDESAVITITGAVSKLEVTKTVKLDCVEVQAVVVTTTTTAPPQVLDEVITQPLAETGVEVRPLGLGAFVAVLIGSVLLRKAHRMRTIG